MSGTTETPTAPTTTPGPVEKLLAAETFLDADELSSISGWPLWKVYELARTGQMPVTRLGRSMRFDPRALAEWIRNGGTAQNGDHS